MNSEKAKKLKEFIKVSAELGCYYKLANCDITMLEVFTLRSYWCSACHGKCCLS